VTGAAMRVPLMGNMHVFVSDDFFCTAMVKVG